MAKIIEKTVEKTEDAPIKIKAPVDPDVQIAKLRFWARLIISLMAFGLFGFLVVKMINKPEELTSSGKDLINLAFGAFLPIIGIGLSLRLNRFTRTAETRQTKTRAKRMQYPQLLNRMIYDPLFSFTDDR